MFSKKMKLMVIFLLSIFLWALSSELNRAWATRYKVWLPSKIVILQWEEVYED